MEVAYLGDTGEHVVDERANGSDCASLLVSAEPHAEPNVVSSSLFGFLFKDLKLDANVREVLCNLTSGPFNRHDS
jgi:hypothetical protein